MYVKTVPAILGVFPLQTNVNLPGLLVNAVVSNMILIIDISILFNYIFSNSKHYLIRLYVFPIGNPECNSATWSRYDGSCCTAQNPCGIGEGDCDRNDQCLGYLVCGKDNCGSGFPSAADCCTGNLSPCLSIPPALS